MLYTATIILLQKRNIWARNNIHWICTIRKFVVSPLHGIFTKFVVEILCSKISEERDIACSSNAKTSIEEKISRHGLRRSFSPLPNRFTNRSEKNWKRIQTLPMKLKFITPEKRILIYPDQMYWDGSSMFMRVNGDRDSVTIYT